MVIIIIMNVYHSVTIFNPNHIKTSVYYIRTFQIQLYSRPEGFFFFSFVIRSVCLRFQNIHTLVLLFALKIFVGKSGRSRFKKNTHTYFGSTCDPEVGVPATNCNNARVFRKSLRSALKYVYTCLLRNSCDHQFSRKSEITNLGPSQHPQQRMR